MIRSFLIAALCALVLAGCASESNFELTSTTMDCETTSCVVTFKVTNTSSRSMALDYEVWLSRNDVRESDNAEMVVVGTADGSIDLASEETRQIEVEVDVSASPNGSRVSVYSSRTPGFIRRIMGS